MAKSQFVVKMPYQIKEDIKLGIKLANEEREKKISNNIRLDCEIHNIEEDGFYDRNGIKLTSREVDYFRESLENFAKHTDCHPDMAKAILSALEIV